MKNKGFILIELLVAMTVFSIGTAGIFMLFIGGTKGGIASIERTNAYLLSLEAWEAVQSIEKNDSSLLTPGNYEIGINNNEWLLIPKGGLMGHFILSNNATDSSIYNNEALISNVDFTKDRKGQLFNAAKFNGFNSSIRVFQDSSLRITGPLTISAWVNGEDGVIIGKYNKEIENGSYFLKKENNTFVFKIFGPQGNDSISSIIENENTWNHVLGVFDPAKPSLSIYINGELKDSKTTTINSLNLSSNINFTIGADASNTNFFNGLISDVRIYNYSLTSSHAMGLYEKYSAKNEKSLEISDTKDLLASWSFDENQGCISHDNSSNRNHGYIRNCQDDLWTTNRFEKENKAFSFNGDSFLEILDSQSLQRQNELSISLWIKLPYPLPLETMVLLHKKAISQNDYSFALSYNGSEKSYEWAISMGQESSLTSIKALNVATSDWQHLLLNYNGSNRKIHINNIEITNITASSFSNISNNSNLYIGQKGDGNNKFTGIIDDLRIYNKTLNNNERIKILTNNNNFFLK